MKWGDSLMPKICDANSFLNCANRPEARSHAYVLLFVITVIAMVLSGCASISGHPSTEFPEEEDLNKNIIALTNQELDTYFSTSSNPKTQRDQRDLFMVKRMAAIDANFNNYIKQIYGEDVISTVGIEWIAIGTATAAALISNSTTQAILAGITGALIGSKAAFDKKALFDRTIIALLSQMTANRWIVRARILDGLKKPVNQYSLMQAHTDLQAYYRAGTIPGAINGILESSTNQAATAIEAIRNLSVVTYGPDEVSKVLRRFWKPDGINVDPENEKRIQAWLDKKRIITFITIFITGQEYGFARKAMAEDLGLIPRD